MDEKRREKARWMDGRKERRKGREGRKDRGWKAPEASREYSGSDKKIHVELIYVRRHVASTLSRPVALRRREAVRRRVCLLHP